MLGVALCAVAFFYLRPAPPAADPVEFVITPAESSRFPGPSPQFAISPDGRHVAFVALTQGARMLWVRSLATLASRSLPGTEGARNPFWSPDSRSIGFFAPTRLKTVQVNGGSPVVICDARPVTNREPGGTWNGNNVIVFGMSDGPLLQVSSTGGTPTPVTTLAKGDTAHGWPWFLPDGQHFLFLAQGLGKHELRVESLTSGDTASLGPFESNGVYAAGHLFSVRGENLTAQAFDVDSRQLSGEPLLLAARTGVNPQGRGIFSVSATGRLAYSRTALIMSHLTWLDRDGKSLGRVGDLGDFYNLNLSPDDQRVAASRQIQQPAGKARVDIWLVDLAGAGAASPLTDDPANRVRPGLVTRRKADRVQLQQTRSLEVSLQSVRSRRQRQRAG